MAASEQLGIRGVLGFHFYVHDAARSAAFYQGRLGCEHTWRSGSALEARTGQHCDVFESGSLRVAVSSPRAGSASGSRAARWLRQHPDGVGSLTFEVADADAALSFLRARDATLLDDMQTWRTPDGGRVRHFAIATAIGDLVFRFAEVRDTSHVAPGFERVASPQRDGKLLGVDHVTCNVPTIAPVRLWMEHVLGLEVSWGISLHTDPPRQPGRGTGLRSVVMRDPRSGVQFPVNEPQAPAFRRGQISRFLDDHHGAGIQHIAILVQDISAMVRDLRARGVQFFDTPASYYRGVPARLQDCGVDVMHIDHDLRELAQLGILIDGSPMDRYILQIFLQDAMTLYDEPEAGPFFFELIERCGDVGFGDRNFRALFEAIERSQLARPA